MAGRWRAITWKHFQSLHPRLDEVQQEACAHLAERIVDILALCGVCGTRVAILNDVIVGFSSPLHDVVKLAFYLEKTITERVISRDLVVVVIQADATFDAAGMVDEWSSPKTVVRASAGSVLCTTQLGLTRAQNLSGGTSGRASDSKPALLLKPKVVLTTVISEILEEQARARGPETRSARRDGTVAFHTTLDNAPEPHPSQRTFTKMPNEVWDLMAGRLTLEFHRFMPASTCSTVVSRPRTWF